MFFCEQAADIHPGHMSNITNPLVKMYMRLPLWAKVVVPAAAFVVFVSLFKSIGLILKVGMVVLVVLFLLSFVNKLGNKQQE